MATLLTLQVNIRSQHYMKFASSPYLYKCGMQLVGQDEVTTW